MLKRFFIFAFLFLSAKLISAQPDSTLLKGIYLSYNLQFAKAEKIFNDEINIHPNSPAPFYFLARNYLWKYLGNRNEENAIILNKYLTLTINKAQAQLDKGEKTEWNYYYMGSAYLLKSAESSAKGKSMQAFWDAKKSVSFFKEALSVNPKFNDALLGLATFSYALSFTPGVFKIALSLSGLDYDKEKAISFFKRAFKKSLISKDEAAFHLSKIYLEYLADYDSASYFVNPIVKKYPQNILFKYLKALILIEEKDLKSAEKVLTQIVKSKNKDLLQTVAFSYFLLGDISFKQNNFYEGVKYYEKFFKSTRIVDFLGYVNLRAAIAYKMIGNENKFHYHLQLCSLGNEHIPDDAFASYASEYYSANGFTKQDSLLQILWNFYESGQLDKGILSAKNYLKEFKNAERKAEALTVEALCNFDLRNYSETIALAKDALRGNFKFKKWLKTTNQIITAYSYYFLQKSEQAEKYLEEAEASNDSFYKNKLSAKINRLKRKLNETE